MAGVTVEELVPASASPREPRARGRRRFSGALVDVSRASEEALRRRGPGPILDRAFDVLIARFAACVGIAALCWLPFQQVSEFLQRAAVGEFTLFSWSLAGVVPRAVATSIVVSLVAGELLGERMQLASALGRGLARAPGVLAILTIAFVTSAPLVLCCIFPFFIGMWAFSAAPAIFVIEGHALLAPAERARLSWNPFRHVVAWFKELGRSIGRGMRLVSGWDSFGRFLAVFVVSEYFLATPLEASGSAFGVPEVREFLRDTLRIGGGPAELVIATISACFFGLAVAFTVSVMTVYYLDLRVRKEGLDLELALRRLAGRPAASERRTR